MSLRPDIPDPLLLAILKKLNAVSFSRLLRTSRWIYEVASCHRKSIRINMEQLDYDVTPPSRRRQMVFIYTGEDDRQKILFPKNFSTFLEQTIPDLAFFRFGKVIFSHRHSDWDKGLMLQMLTAMRNNGFSCQTLVNEVPVLLEETIRSLRPLELAVLRPFDLVAEVQEAALKTLRSVECVPCDTKNILATISNLSKLCAKATIWAHNVQETDLKGILLPKLALHLQEISTRERSAGQLNLYVSNAKSDPFLEMLNLLGAKVIKNDTTVAFLSSIGEKKVAVILFEDFNDVPYTMFHYKFVTGFDQFKKFRDEVVQEETEDPGFWADIKSCFSQ